MHVSAAHQGNEPVVNQEESNGKLYLLVCTARKATMVHCLHQRSFSTWSYFPKMRLTMRSTTWLGICHKNDFFVNIIILFPLPNWRRYLYISRPNVEHWLMPRMPCKINVYNERLFIYTGILQTVIKYKIIKVLCCIFLHLISLCNKEHTNNRLQHSTLNSN